MQMLRSVVGFMYEKEITTVKVCKFVHERPLHAWPKVYSLI